MSGPRLYFPNVCMAMLRPPANFPTNQVILRVPPILNKYDIRNYIEALYNVKVLKVNTVKFLGSWKRDSSGRYVHLASWKKAYVTFEGEFEFPPPLERENFMKD